MTWPPANKRPLTDKQVRIMAYLVAFKGPHSSRDIAAATGCTGIASTLHALRFRGLIEITRARGQMLVTREAAA